MVTDGDEGMTGIGGDPANNPYTAGDDPGNTLEVNSFGLVTDPGGSSGLRFTDLNTTSPPLPINPHPIPSVLTVDANGDVVLVQDQIGSGIGTCAAPTVLSANSGVLFNGYNIYHEGQDRTGYRFSIGYPCDAGIDAKFKVLNSFNSTLSSMNKGGEFVCNGNYTFASSAIAVRGFTIVTGDINEQVGGQFVAIGTGARGVQGIAQSDNGIVIAGEFRSTMSVSQPITGNFALRTIAQGGYFAYGAYTAAQNGTYNYGIYAEAGPPSGTTPPSGPNYAGYFNGDVVRTGTDNFACDAMFKTNIAGISNALDIIDQLEAHTFSYDTSMFPSIWLPRGRQYGLIAQEVEKVLPDLVSPQMHPPVIDTLGNVIHAEVAYKGLNYNGFIPILIAAVKEQQAIIDSMLIVVGQCCEVTSPGGGGGSRWSNTNDPIHGKLRTEGAILYDAIPNPFQKEVSIAFFIPEGITDVAITFHDNYGRVLKTMNIGQRGNGNLILDSGELAAGTYTYSMVADGQLVDTKKMVRMK